MAINFCKFHGFGNDYIVIESAALKDDSSVNELARQICHRHYGAGSDGIALIEKLDGKSADFKCRIINPDGSEASFSGNGTRCAVAYLYYQNLWNEKNLRLETASGIKNYTLLEENGKTYKFLAELGKAKFAAADIPFAGEKTDEPLMNYGLQLKTDVLPVTILNPGNPVAAVFVEDFDRLDWRRIGAEIEVHPQFPERTNVVFIRNQDAENIEIRIWERGAAETSSSGTCSIAAAVAHLLHENRRGNVHVHAVGGTTEAVWRDDGEMLITGTADFVYCGEWKE